MTLDDDGGDNLHNTTSGKVACIQIGSVAFLISGTVDFSISSSSYKIGRNPAPLIRILLWSPPKKSSDQKGISPRRIEKC